MQKLTRSLVRMAFAIGVGSMMCTTAHAGLLTYTSLPLPVPDNRPDDQVAATAAENSFLGTLSSYRVEKFEVVNDPPTIPATSPTTPTGSTAEQPLAFGGIYVSGEIPYAVARFSGVFTLPPVPTVISSPNALLLQPAAAGQPAYNNDFTFSTPITAFGSYFIQAGDVAANTLTLRLENTLLGTSKDVVMGTVGPNANFNNVFYFGLTDTDAFNRVTLLPSNGGDGILLDNVTAGYAVPEVGSFSLLAVGLALPVLARTIVRRAKVS